ncbi:hypothetical protein ACKAV7_005950 [Fusarium commune]
MTRELGSLIVALNQLLGEVDQTGHRTLGFMPLSLLMKKLGRSLATAHPPPEPYAKKSRQSSDDTGGNEKVARSVAARTNHQSHQYDDIIALPEVPKPNMKTQAYYLH